MKDSPVSIQIHSKDLTKRVFIFLVLCEILLIFLDIFINHHRWSSIGAMRRLVNITREDSIGTWFSSTQMILCGVALYFNALTCKGSKAKANKKRYYSWMTIAGFFTFMGIDDAVKFHERVGSIVKALLNRGVSDGTTHPILEMFPSYPWQLVFGPFFGAMGLFIFYFLWKELEKPKLRSYLIAALSLYVIAVGLDFVEGMDNPYVSISQAFGTTTKNMRHYSKALEEFLEMLGTTFFLMAFMKKLFSEKRQWSIQIK